MQYPPPGKFQIINVLQGVLNLLYAPKERVCAKIVFGDRKYGCILRKNKTPKNALLLHNYSATEEDISAIKSCGLTGGDGGQRFVKFDV